MILKSFEIDKKQISNFKFFLIYGENEGLKKELINKIKNKHSGKVTNFEEAKILLNKSGFYNEIKNRSLFDEKKIYLIERCSEKILEIVLEIISDKINDPIIICCGLLEKKSKLRNLIEKSDEAIIIPTYKDNTQSLVNIAKVFFSEKKISISYETLNLLVNRCNGDRGHLKQELEKISNYSTNKKVLSLKEISVLTNLSENYSAAELVDASLSKNIKKTQEILDENNYSQEDTFLIIRIFLQKTKKILNLKENIEDKKDIDKIIAEHKPPIFWKEKPIIKKQLQMWSLKSIKDLIYKLNDIELKIKKNSSLSIFLMKNFIFEVTSEN
tara:strand:- start:588 stop:1571 length:984 start_codon:yes stop_codon:yes gene_type:complete